jgi:hypothetical protein
MRADALNNGHPFTLAGVEKSRKYLKAGGRRKK